MTLGTADTVATRPATASELLLIIGSDSAPIEALPDGAARQLAGEYRGRRIRLAPHLAAVAFWSLHRQGAISLEVRRSKALGFISRTELVAGLGQPAQAIPGIEGQLLSVIGRRKPGDVGGVVREWFGRPSSDVDGVVIRRVMEQASQTGLLSITREDAGRGLIGGVLRGKEKEIVAADAAAMASVAGEISQVASDWLAFPQSQPDLSAELANRCQKALDSRKPVDSDGGDFGGDADD
jgi:hypothetical protein